MATSELHTPRSIEINCEALDRATIDDLQVFLKSQEGVTQVNSRVLTMDAAWDPSLIKTAVITGLVVKYLPQIGNKALDLVFDLLKDWIKQRNNQNIEIETSLYGPDDKPIIRLKKR